MSLSLASRSSLSSLSFALICRLFWQELIPLTLENVSLSVKKGPGGGGSVGGDSPEGRELRPVA